MACCCNHAAQLDVTFPGLPCGWLSLDAMDVSGELELDVDHDIFRKRLDSSGKPISEGEKHEVGRTASRARAVS